MDLFNATHGLMLQFLTRFFTHSGETPEELTTLADSAIGTMATVLAPLGALITRSAAGPSFGELAAGPSFEVHRAQQPSPHYDAAWAVLRAKLRELVDYSTKLLE